MTLSKVLADTIWISAPTSVTGAFMRWAFPTGLLGVRGDRLTLESGKSIVRTRGPRTAIAPQAIHSKCRIFFRSAFTDSEALYTE